MKTYRLFGLLKRLILIALTTGFAQLTVSPLLAWERTYGGPGTDYGRYVCQTRDEGFLITGYTDSYGAGSYDVYLIKTNSRGDTLWTKTYGGRYWDCAYGAVQAPDGGYYVPVWTASFGPGTPSYPNPYLIRTNAQGDTLWTRFYGGLRGDGFFYGIETRDGNYVFTGYTASFGAGAEDVYLVKINPQGDTLWTRTFGGYASDMGYSVQQTRDGGFIIAAQTISFGAGSCDAYLIKTDPQGNAQWCRTYGGQMNDYAISVQQTSDDGYIFGGYTASFGNGAHDFFLVRTDSMGDTLWTRTYGGGLEDWGASVQQTRDGCFLFLGWTASFGLGGEDMYLVKADAQGDTLWTKTYGGTNHDRGYSIHPVVEGTACRGYVLAGYTLSFGRGYNDVFLIGIDESGASGIENATGQRMVWSGLRVRPNPFCSQARIPDHEKEWFHIYDVTGKKIATQRGDQIGAGLPAGIFFLQSLTKDSPPLRVVKLR